MKNFSIKIKFLMILISISVIGLMIFGYLSFHKYKEDKLAFVYGSMATETESKKEILTRTIEGYDLLLTYMMSGMDLRSKTLSDSSLQFLSKNKKISGVYYHVPTDPTLHHISLFDLKDSGFKTLSWQSLDSSPLGFSIVDQEDGLFIYKKELSIKGSYAVLYFNQPDLISLFRSNKKRLSLLYRNNINITSIGERSDLSELSKQLKDQVAAFGLFETSISGEKYFISYAKNLDQKFTFVNVIPQSSVLLVQKVFVNQIGLVLCLIVSISLIVATLSSRWLTWQLDDLTYAVEEVKKENFNIQVDVQSRDELGLLGIAFNSMTEKITHLLEELRKHNLELEKKVLERTKELQQLNNIQKAMLNSLGQGFVMIDKDTNLSHIFSKVAVDMYETEISTSSLKDVLALPDKDAENFSELISLAFQGMMTPEDVTQLLPEQRTNSKDQKIFLDYALIKDEKESLEYILIIGTDKTKELESIEKFNKEWNFSQMILKAVKNRFTLNKVISESIQMLSLCSKTLDSKQAYPLRAIQRSIHTVKGSFSYFNIPEITSLCHEAETYLNDFYDVEICTEDLKIKVYSHIANIEDAIDNYIQSYDEIIHYKEASTSKLLPTKDINNFYQYLKTRDSSVAYKFKDTFSQTQIEPYFQIYPAMISDLAIRLNKKVNFVIEGAKEWLPDDNWSSLFQEFVHAVRNSMDHGIETPLERLANGKSETGIIKFSFKKSDDILSITIEDDGRGIDWKKIAAKDASITNEEEALTRIIFGGISSREAVTDISGRGVGVSALFNAVKECGGKIRFDNKLNIGLKIHIEIPIRKQSELQLVA